MEIVLRTCFSRVRLFFCQLLTVVFHFPYFLTSALEQNIWFHGEWNLLCQAKLNVSVFHFSKKYSFHCCLNNSLPFSFPSPPLNFTVWFGKAISGMTALVVRHSSLSLTNFYQIFQSEFKAAMWVLWKLVSHKMVETILVLPLKKRQTEFTIWQPLLGCSAHIHDLIKLYVL